MKPNTIKQKNVPPVWLAPSPSAATRARLVIKAIIAMAAVVGLAASAGAQIMGFTADPTNTQYGTYADNGGASGGLNIGRTMAVSGGGIEVFQLGVYDFNSDGLATAHTVTLFNADTQAAVASVTVPAGTSAPLINAFRFAPLNAPVFLPAGNYSIVAYQMNGTNTQNSDPYGNGNAPGFNGGGNVSPGAGIYDFVTSPSPAYPGSTSGEQFAAVSFTYTNVPPATGIWTGGGGNNNWSTVGNWNGAPVFPTALTFAGSTRLVNTNDNAGITVNGLTFDAAAGAFMLDGNDITLAGNIGFSVDGVGFSVNPVAPITQTINLNMLLSTGATIDTPTNGNLNLAGTVMSSADTSLIKLDAGTLTLGGTNAITSWDLCGGTTTIMGSTTINGDGNSRIYVGDGDYLNDCNGTLVIQPGAALSIIGNYADDFVIGRDSGSGTLIQNGGTFIFNNNRANMWIGATGSSATRAEFDMNGGLLDLSGSTLGVGLGNGVLITGAVYQVSGVITNVGNLWLGGATPNGYGAYTISGGSIYIGTNTVSQSSGITTVSGLYAINLGGGTVGAFANWSSSMNINLTNLNGSVTFDTAGNLITLSGALSGSGGLTVAGAGVLELSGANTYTGDTTVSAGSTLKLDVAGSSVGAFRAANGATLNLNYSGTYVVGHFYTNGIALPVGIYNSSNLGGFITGSGSVQVAGIVFATQPQNQLVYLNGNYHQSATLTSAITGGSATYQWYLNGNPISGATSSSLTLSNLSITTAGNVFVVATGALGSVTSSVVALTIYGVNNTVFAYDGFAYPGSTDDSTPIDGTSQNGGFGWAIPWTGAGGTTANTAIGLGSLVGGINVPAGFDSRSIGNSIEDFGGSRVGRFFDTSTNSQLYIQGFIDANGNIGADGKTVYLSFLQQPSVTGGGLFYELEFKKDNLGDPGRIGGIGNDTGTGNVNLRAGGVNNYSLGTGDTGVDFYVVRIDYKAGNDDVFVYRNPTSLTEPVTPTLVVSNAADMSFNGVSVAAFNGPALNIDEIRLGATWADAIGLAVSNLLPPTKTAGGYTVQFACTPGYSYRIQRATTPLGPWTDIDTMMGPQDGFVIYQDTSVSAGNVFYRTVTP